MKQTSSASSVTFITVRHVLLQDINILQEKHIFSQCYGKEIHFLCLRKVKLIITTGFQFCMCDTVGVSHDEEFNVD